MDNKTLYWIFVELHKLAIQLADGYDATITGIEMRPLDGSCLPGHIEIAVSDGDTTHKIEATYSTYSCESKGEQDA